MLSSAPIGLLGAALFYDGWFYGGLTLGFQAVASFMADVWCCGVPSLWHGIDKWTAAASATQLMHTFTTRATECLERPTYVPVARFLAATLGPFAIAMRFFSKSAAAQKAGDMRAFFFNHACWHYVIGVGGFAVVWHC